MLPRRCFFIALDEAGRQDALVLTTTTLVWILVTVFWEIVLVTVVVTGLVLSVAVPLVVVIVTETAGPTVTVPAVSVDVESGHRRNASECDHVSKAGGKEDPKGRDALCKV